MPKHTSKKAIEVLDAAGAKEVVVPPSSNMAHLRGTARMGTNEKTLWLVKIIKYTVF